MKEPRVRATEIVAFTIKKIRTAATKTTVTATKHLSPIQHGAHGCMIMFTTSNARLGVTIIIRKIYFYPPKCLYSLYSVRLLAYEI